MFLLKTLVPEKSYAEKQFIFGIHSKINANFKTIAKTKVCLHDDAREKISHKQVIYDDLHTIFT